MIQGMLAVITFFICEKRESDILIIACVSYILVHFIFSQFIVANRFVSNTLDKVYTNMVYQEILEYEERTGIKVTGLSVVEDTFTTDYYDEVGYKSYQINEKALGTVTNSLLTVVSGRSFERISMPDEIYEKYFEGKNWDYFDITEQLIIRENIAYWCVF